MLDTFRQLIAQQYEAAFRTVCNCLEQCPQSIWDQPVATFPFSQTVFHTLFFADLYLGENIEAQPRQEFHRINTATFSGYAELEDDTPLRTYTKEFNQEYLKFCRSKADDVVKNETEEQLKTPAGFPWLPIQRAEVHVYNIRHIQHHAAQLVLKLRLETELDPRWVKSGWDT